MSSPDYDTFNAMTPAQQQEWYREQKKDIQRLGGEITQFLRWLCERNSTEEYRQHNGMWNCQSWLVAALDANGIPHKHMHAHAHQAETVTFETNDATLTIAEHDVSVHTMHFEETDDTKEDDDDPHFLGTALEMNLHGSTPATNFRLGLRWFAYNSDTASDGMTLDDFYQGLWAFPPPVWCHLLGNTDHVRSWLMRTKLSFK